MRRFLVSLFAVLLPLCLFAIGPKGGGGGGVNPSSDPATFNYGIIVNEDSNDSDTRIETNDIADFISIDAGINALGINATPSDTTNTTMVVEATSSTSGHDILRVNNTSASPLFVVQHGGNVGIGTSAPSANSAGLNIVHATQPGFRMSAGTADAEWVIDGTTTSYFQTLDSGGSWRWLVGAADTLGFAVDAGGNLGIGTTAPQTRLAVTDGFSSGSTTTLAVNGASTTIKGPVAFTSSVASGYSPGEDVMVSNLMPKALAHVSVSGGVPLLDYAINVASVTDITAGEIRINWDRNFGTTNYFFTVIPASGSANYNEVKVNCVDIETRDGVLGTLLDDVDFFIMAFGDN